MQNNVNSKEYWDERFASGDWEEKGGNQQTHYFYELLCALLPEHLKQEFDNPSKHFSMADVGCAEGDGTKLLSETFPNAEITGIDIAKSAIQKAQSLYTDISFSNKLDKQYDIVISSNVLEHFEDPFVHLNELFNHSNQYVVILVPFEEYDRIDEHFYTFLYKDFKLKFNGFNLIHIHGIQADKNIWDGKQHLFIYQKNANLNEISLESFGLEKMIKEKEQKIRALTQEKEQEIQALTQKKEHEFQNLKNQFDMINNELTAIKQSSIWKLATKYYHIRDHGIYSNHFYKFTKSIKNQSRYKTFKNLITNIQTKHNQKFNFRLPSNNVLENGGNKGKVSIVLPVYNQADMIEESIKSVLAQTYENFELIIVNDGSTDNVETVISKFQQDARIIFLTQKNQKLPIALNNGFYFATGDYYTWTSADNIMLPNQIELLVKKLQINSHAGMVFSDYQVINEEGEPLQDPTFRPQNQDQKDPSIMRLPQDVTFKNLHDSGDNYIGASFMYRKNVAKIIGKYTNDTFGGEDYDYWLRIHNLFPIVHVNEVLYKYRVHPNTLNSRAKELNLATNIKRLLERDKLRRHFLEQPIEFIQHGSHFDLPGKKCQYSVHLYYNQYNLIEEGDFKVLFTDTEINDIEIESLIKFDLLICSHPETYKFIDHKRPNKYKVLYLHPNKNKDIFIEIIKNRFFDKMHINEKSEILPAIVTNKRLHICFVLESFGAGGLEKVVYNLAISLKKYFNITILIIGKEKGLFGEKILEDGIDVWNANFEIETFKSIIKNSNFDIMNYHYTLFGIELCKEYTLPIIYTVHNTYVWLDNQEIEKRTKQYKQIDQFVCVSNNVMKYFIKKFNIHSPNINIIPNGFNVSDFASTMTISRADLDLSDEDFIFINLASINGSKMQLLIVEAMRELKKQHNNFKVLFVGNILDINYHTIINNKIIEYDLKKNIIFLDHVPMEKVGALLKTADCFLLPSLYEGWSNAIMEAMYCELPLILTNVGSANNLVIDNDIGIIINNATPNLLDTTINDILKTIYEDFKNKDELINAMLDIYTNYSIWKNKAVKGKEKIINTFTLSDMRDDYKDIFYKVYIENRQKNLITKNKYHKGKQS